MKDKLIAPFPYFGGKSTVAAEVWKRFGAVRHYCEPFFGSGAVLLLRPEPFDGPETVNDADGMVVNAWRALQSDPAAVAQWADQPVFECDLHARHIWLKGRRSELVERLEGDPDYYDAKVAGWWVWGMSIWIGSGFCSDAGPWAVEDGRLVKTGGGAGVRRQRPHLSFSNGVIKQTRPLGDWFDRLSARLRRVRVVCGGWDRVIGPSVLTHPGTPTGIFLDPPYSAEAGRNNSIYAHESLTVAHEVRAWAIEHGDDPRLRIALCGYADEHAMPPSWSVLAWKANGGYSNANKEGNTNRHQERIWFSPHCLSDKNVQQGALFECA